MVTNPVAELRVRNSSVMNWLSKIGNALDKVGTVTMWMNTVSLIFFFLMICLAFVDVVLRYFFNKPILGTTDMISLMLVILVGFGISHTQNEHGHIGVDVIVSLIKPKARLVLNTITTLIGIGLMGIMTWQSFVAFQYVMKTNKMAAALPTMIPASPFNLIITIGCAFFFILLIRDLIKNLIEGLQIQLRAYQWVLIPLITAIVIYLCILWLQPSTLSNLNLSMVGLIGIAISIILLFSGMPIAFSMILTGFLMVGHIRGVNMGLDMLGTEIYGVFSNYLWAVLAFFVIMGLFCLYARFGEDLYYIATKWIGHWAGGLCVATIAACTAMAAVVGDTLSVVSTMTTVALPQMRKEKYDVGLCTGTIAAGAILGPMIPPSMTFIMYGILTQQSIGQLFMAGIIPGILLAVGLGASIYLQCRLKPWLGPASKKSSWKERFSSTKSITPVLLLFVLVIGGIYAGVFTPTEGGAIGASGALIIGLIMRRFTWSSFRQSLLDAGKIVAMIFFILLGATLMTRFIAWCNISESLGSFINGLALPAYGKMIFILMMFFFLGFVIDVLPITLIMVPICHPIAVSLGYDPIWVAVIIVAMLQIGLITPPVATNLFAIKGIAKDIPITTIYKGIIPFILACVVVIVILFVAKPLVLWLPNLLF